MYTQKKFLQFRYAAIKRYGEKKWTAATGEIEFNPNYTVSCGKEETGLFNSDTDVAYVIELSNGTKFIAFQHIEAMGSEVLSESGEYSNQQVPERTINKVLQSIGAYNHLK